MAVIDKIDGENMKMEVCEMVGIMKEEFMGLNNIILEIKASNVFIIWIYFMTEETEIWVRFLYSLLSTEHFMGQ